jgi:hypothetical protein
VGAVPVVELFELAPGVEQVPLVHPGTRPGIDLSLPNPLAQHLCGADPEVRTTPAMTLEARRMARRHRRSSRS